MLTTITIHTTTTKSKDKMHTMPLSLSSMGINHLGILLSPGQALGMTLKNAVMAITITGNLRIRSSTSTCQHHRHISSIGNKGKPIQAMQLLQKNQQALAAKSSALLQVASLPNSRIPLNPSEIYEPWTFAVEEAPLPTFIMGTKYFVSLWKTINLPIYVPSVALNRTLP
jgi:hypothetical protein